MRLIKIHSQSGSEREWVRGREKGSLGGRLRLGMCRGWREQKKNRLRRVVGVKERSGWEVVLMAEELQ